MSNIDNPNGFNFLSINKPYPPLEKVFEKLATQGTAIFQNDVVHQIAGVAGYRTGPIEPFGTATPGTTIPLGVSGNYGAASTRTRHRVIIDQDAEYHAQDDGDTDGVGATETNLNANVSTGAGSTLTGYSGHEIDEASLNASSSRDLHLLGIWDDPTGLTNVIGSSHVRMICKFNHHRYAANTVGV